MWRRTAGERALILKKEEAIKGLCELCVLRCVRPDHLLESFDRFVKNVLDPEYLDFKSDILPKWEAERRRGAAGKDNYSHAQSLQSMKPAGGSEGSLAPGWQGAIASGTGAGAGHGRPSDASPPKRESRSTKGGLNNPVTLLNAAFADSTECSPILCVASEGVDVLELITDFHQRRGNALGGAKLRHFSLGDGLTDVLDTRLEQSAQSGEWVLLENIHLVPDWLPTLEQMLSDWAKPETHPRFRVWASAEPGYEFPATLLEKCVKIALQPPKTMRRKIEKMLLRQEKEGFFRKSGSNAGFHKNVFFGLAYLHSNLGGRRRYGTLGWQRPYVFANSDFDISLLQLKDVLKQEQGRPNAQRGLHGPLKVLRYFFTEINYAGKIHCAEDLAVLRAVMDDLINEEISFCVELPEDTAKSHHGFPPQLEAPAYFDWLERGVPLRDAYEIFGFNWEIESRHQRAEIMQILSQLYEVNKQWNTAIKPVDEEFSKSLQMSALKSSLGSGGSLSV